MTDLADTEAGPGAQATGQPWTWGTAVWGTDYWQARTWPPGASWKTNWRWWFQDGRTANPAWDITAKVVEARWTTDGYTLGDGTFRGDCQPGHLNVRIYDPAQTLLGLSRLGTLWATFVPTGATWCWFVNSITGNLAPSKDPALNEIVVTADTWPPRLTASSYNSGRPAESVSARFAAIVNRLNTDSGLVLPAVSGAIAADAHTVAAVVNTTEGSTVMPGFLQQLRDAGANGLMWLEAVAGADSTMPGVLVVHYDLAETVDAKALYNDQVVAASLWEQGQANLITEVAWHGVDGAGVASDFLQFGGGWGQYGLAKRGPMRVWADVSQSGAARSAVTATGNQILTDRGDPQRPYVEQIQQVSGDRLHSAWDPTRFTWGPRWVIQWYRVDGQPQESYRVVKSDHVLNARSWTITHTLEPFTSPTHIP